MSVSRFDQPQTILGHPVCIATKYIPATNHRPSRIKATLAAGWQSRFNSSVVVPFDYELDLQDTHRKAVSALLVKLNADELAHTFEDIGCRPSACNSVESANPLKGWGFLFTVCVRRNEKGGSL